MRNISYLDPWLARRSSLPPWIDLRDPDLDLAAGALVGVCGVSSIDAEEAQAWRSLDEAWHDLRAYVAAANQASGGLDSGWLDREDAGRISSQLGQPPPWSWPLHFASIHSPSTAERVVHVGTSTRRECAVVTAELARVRSDAQIEGGLARVYRCCVLIKHRSLGWAPVESLQALDSAEAVVEKLAARLRAHFGGLVWADVDAHRSLPALGLTIRNSETAFLDQERLPPEQPPAPGGLASGHPLSI